MSFSSFLDAEQISGEFIVPTVTVRKIHGRVLAAYNNFSTGATSQ